MSAGLAARITAAEAALAEFRDERTWTASSGPMDMWALRLASVLGDLLGWLELDGAGPRPRIDGSVAASGVLPDGSTILSPADLQTALGALSDAAEYRANSHGSQDRDRAQATAYRALSYRLGDDR